MGLLSGRGKKFPSSVVCQYLSCGGGGRTLPVADKIDTHTAPMLNGHAQKGRSRGIAPGCVQLIGKDRKPIMMIQTIDYFIEDTVEDWQDNNAPTPPTIATGAPEGRSKNIAPINLELPCANSLGSWQPGMTGKAGLLQYLPHQPTVDSYNPRCAICGRPAPLSSTHRWGLCDLRGRPTTVNGFQP